MKMIGHKRVINFTVTEQRNIGKYLIKWHANGSMKLVTYNRKWRMGSRTIVIRINTV
jgi:hypothetical protein